METQSPEVKKKPLNKSLKRIMFGQCISMIGDNFTLIALTWYIVQTGSAMQVGINMALKWLPTFILAPFIGAIVDRVSRKKLLWGSDILRLLIDLILIVVITKGWFSIYIVYIYTVLKAIVRQFYTPAQRAVIQQLSTSESRVAANALQFLSLRIAMVVGPLLAGLAVKYLPRQGVIAIDALTFLISAMIVLSITLDESHIKKQGKEHSYSKQMKDGLVYVAAHRWILLLAFAYAFVNAGNMLANVARPFLIKDQLGLGVDAFGLLASLGSCGGLLVSAALVKIKLKSHRLNYVIISILIRGAGVILLSTAASFWMVVIIQFAVMSMVPVLGINSNAFVQNEIPSEFMGRVQSVRSFIGTMAMPAGALFGATLIKYFGVSGSFVIAGSITLVGAGFAYIAKKMHCNLHQITTAELSD